ncbi:hypothetical protein [Nostoc sp.]|uniref:hypothetical protein n=1 Tax=Nostoc sp. TaxID=1180 RepID=UPI002FFA636E
MVNKHNGIVPSKGGERTTPLEAPQHRLYYCASTSTSFPACRVKLTNILPLKTSLVVCPINFVGLLEPRLLQEVGDLNTTNLSKLLGQTISGSSTRKCWVRTGKRKILYNSSSFSIYPFISQGLLHLTLTLT